MTKSRSRRTRSTTGPGVRGMGKEIRGLAGKLMRQFRKAHPGGDQYRFRDGVEALFHQALTQRIRGKPRGDSMITRAERMWRRQLAEKRRKKRTTVYWVRIAATCIPGFGALPEPERGLQLYRLKNAVIKRNHRAAKRAERRAKLSAADHAESEYP